MTEIQSISRKVKCFAVQVCKSFRRNWRIDIYFVDRIHDYLSKNNQLCFDPNVKRSI